jgi:LDH2 family malate/lactate/ureidoglycolate dehydrogenase
MMSGPLAGSDAFPGVKARNGIFIFALRADLFRPMAAYEDALSKSIRKIKAIPPTKGFSQVMMPGEPEYQTKLSREKNGIEIQVDTWESVRKAAMTIGINIDN